MLLGKFCGRLQVLHENEETLKKWLGSFQGHPLYCPNYEAETVGIREGRAACWPGNSRLCKIKSESHLLDCRVAQLTFKQYSIGFITWLHSSSGNNVTSVDDSRDVTQKGEDNIDQKIGSTSLQFTKFNLTCQCLYSQYSPKNNKGILARCTAMASF